MSTKINVSDTILHDYQVSNPLAEVLAEFEDLRQKMSKVEFYQTMAGKLGDLVGENGWTWRYIQGVEKGTIRPSGRMSEAIRRMGETIDGRHADLTGLIPVSVLAGEGVVSGSIVLGKSKVCANPKCNVMFVSDHPRRRYCSRECRK